MILRLQRYNLEVNFKKGTEMYTADLCRMYIVDLRTATSKGEVKDEKYFDIFYNDLENTNFTEYLTFNDARILQIQRETMNDSVLISLKNIVISGCPENIQKTNSSSTILDV